jgi:hypothetical protein
MTPWKFNVDRKGRPYLFRRVRKDSITFSSSGRPLFALKGNLGITVISILMFISGPIGALRQLRHAVYLIFGGLYFQNDGSIFNMKRDFPGIENELLEFVQKSGVTAAEASEQIVTETVRRMRNEKLRVGGGFVAILIANPVIAAGLLWWNAAEIERLTAGIG